MAVNRWDIIVLLVAVMSCCRFALPLLEPEEARYAELPRQLMESGSWLIPTLDGQPYLDKPPLLYWLVAAAYEAFGVSVVTSRIIPTLAAAFTVWIVFQWVRTTQGQSAGLIAAAVLLIMPDFLYRGPQLTMNGLLAAMTTASMATGYAAIAKNRFRWSWWIASAVFCGMGLLAKGPVAAALVGLPFVIVPWLDRRLVRPSILAVIVFAIIAVAVAGPWFLLVAQRQPDFINYFFWKHHVDRVVNPFDHAKPWWYFLPQVLLGTLPWTPLLFLMAYRWLRSHAVPSLAIFGFVAGAIGITLFSISGSKRPVYLVPVYPPLAVAVAAFLWHEIEAGRNVFGMGRTGWIRFTAITAVAMGTFFVVFLPQYHHRFSAEPAIQQAVNSSELPSREYAVPYGSPAASFELRRTIPIVALDQLNTIAPPQFDERVLLFVPPRQVSSIVNLLTPGCVETVHNGEIAILAWWSAK